MGSPGRGAGQSAGPKAAEVVAGAETRRSARPGAVMAPPGGSWRGDAGATAAAGLEGEGKGGEGGAGGEEQSAVRGRGVMSGCAAALRARAFPSPVPWLQPVPPSRCQPCPAPGQSRTLVEPCTSFMLEPLVDKHRSYVGATL